MTRCIRSTFGICFFCFNYFIVFMPFSEGSEHFAFTGCNATLQWNLVNRPSKLKGIIVRINDTTGNVIVSTRNDQCTSRDNLAVRCAIFQKSEDWIISLGLLNLTTNHSGNYTAWIKQELHIETMIKQLIVIDKPQIMELRKPIHHEAFAVTCKTSYVPDCLTYQWKINGAAMSDTSHVQINYSTLTYTNLTMMDNLSKLVCQVGMGNCNIIGYNCSSSEESEPYTVILYYGPSNVSMTVNKRDVYLHDNEIFSVNCWANCYPNCNFRWEGSYINVSNDDLVITNFNEKLSGAYTCIATNRETGATSKSNPIFLHHAKDPFIDRPKEDSAIYLLGVGLVIVTASLIIVGVLICATHKHKYASSRLVSQTVHEPCLRPPSTDIPLDTLNIDKHDIPLPIPAVHEIAFRMMRRSWYPNLNRKSRSLQTFCDHDQDSWSPIRQSLSLQSLIQLSYTVGRRTQSDLSLRKLNGHKKNSWFSMRKPENEIAPEEQYSKVNKNKKESIDEQNSSARSLSLNKVRPESFELESQQDLYSTIDQNNWSGYDYATVKKEEESLHESQRNSGAGNYEYDYVTYPALL